MRHARDRHSERGQTISEAMVCVLIICLVLFCLMQIFYVSVAQMITDYSAYTSARSRAVGFADYLTDRNARVAAIAASGLMTYPESAAYMSNPLSQFAAEAVRIPEYMRGDRWLEYEFWYGDNEPYNTTLGISRSTGASTVSSYVEFHKYPYTFPMKGAFTGSDTLNISGQTQVLNYSQYYLE